jgi:hypothetical protein
MPKPLITFHEFMTNPAGKGSAMIASRDAIIGNLTIRAAELVKVRPPEFTAFTEGDGYVLLYSIGSEEYNLYYDVVLRFLPPETFATEKHLKNYPMQVFSNSPNFNFTYAYVCERDGWLIPELRKKLSRQALTEPPDVRNPAGLMGFEKSIFFAMLMSLEYHLISKNTLRDHLEGAVNWKNIFASVKTFDEKLAEYDRAKKRDSEKKKREKDALKASGKKKVKPKSRMISNQKIGAELQKTTNSRMMNALKNLNK